MGTLTLFHTGERSYIHGWKWSKLQVLVDGEPSGSVSFDKEMTLELLPGSHAVQVTWPSWHRALGLANARCPSASEVALVQVPALGDEGEIALCCGLRAAGEVLLFGETTHGAALDIWPRPSGSAVADRLDKDD